VLKILYMQKFNKGTQSQLKINWFRPSIYLDSCKIPTKKAAAEL
jgi:hypothetical protein